MPLNQPKEPAEVVHNDPATWLGAIWHVLEMAREDCICEDQNGPHDRAWEEVCTAMAWVSEELGVEQTQSKGVQS